MNDYLPLPADRRFHRQTGIVEPLLVEEFASTVRETTPGERRDLVDHLTKRVFGTQDGTHNLSAIIQSSPFDRTGSPRTLGEFPAAYSSRTARIGRLVRSTAGRR